MKRSEINAVIKKFEALLAEYKLDRKCAGREQHHSDG